MVEREAIIDGFLIANIWFMLDAGLDGPYTEIFMGTNAKVKLRKVIFFDNLKMEMANSFLLWSITVPPF